MHMYPKNLTVVFLPRSLFSCQCYFFPANVTAKTLSFFTSCNFSQVDIINFPSCHPLQVNHCQNIIICSIMKIHVQKQKQSLILFHMFGIIIIFWGLMKITGKAYVVIQFSICRTHGDRKSVVGPTDINL